MRQCSLLDIKPDYSALAGVLPCVRAAMNRVAGDAESEGRKLLVDKMNSIANAASIKLTSGNSKEIEKATLDKWLSPSDMSHPPSINTVLVFCLATGNAEPFRVLAKALNLSIMTEEDRRYRDIGKADVELKAARKRKKRLEEELS